MISKKLKAGGAMLALSAALMLGSSVSAYAQVPDEVNTQSTAASTEAGSGKQSEAAAGSVAAQTKASSESTASQTQEAGKSEADTGSEVRITGTADSGTADSDQADSGNGVLTPSGNLSLVDDVSDADAEKMDFMTVTSKDGHVFYIVIDHNAASQNVYFLNQVDESDLMALMSDQDKEALKTNKEDSGTESADAEEVVKPTVRDTSEVSPDASKTSQKTETKKNAVNSNMILAAVLGIIGLIVIAAYYFLKIKPGKGGSSIADDLEFYDDEEYEKDDDEAEPEFEEETGEAGTEPENEEKASKDAPEEGDHL